MKGKAGGVVVVAIDLPTKSSSPPNGGFLMLLPRMGDSLLMDCGDGVFVKELTLTHHFKSMYHFASYAHLYKRVKYLTNIGHHAEASALFTDLLARKFHQMDRDLERRNP